MAEVIDINVFPTIETVDVTIETIIDNVVVTVQPTTDDVNINITPNLITINVNQVIGGGAVESVNGQTGVVVIAIPDATSDLTNDSGFITAAQVPVVNDATASVKGILKLTNDLGGTAELPTVPQLVNKVPYTGATTNVDLGTHSITAKDLIVTHPSGSGDAATITKGGSGEALKVVKTSGSGNAASITGGVTLLSELNLTTDLADAYIASAPVWNAKQNASTRRNANNSSNNNINYNGVALGTAVSESATVWTITRLTISASGAITIATATNVAWTNRESATYI